MRAWGSGKTSLLKLIKKELIKKEAGQKWIIVEIQCLATPTN